MLVIQEMKRKSFICGQLAGRYYVFFIQKAKVQVKSPLMSHWLQSGFKSSFFCHLWLELQTFLPYMILKGHPLVKVRLVTWRSQIKKIETHILSRCTLRQGLSESRVVELSILSIVRYRFSANSCQSWLQTCSWPVTLPLIEMSCCYQSSLSNLMKQNNNTPTP